MNSAPVITPEMLARYVQRRRVDYDQCSQALKGGDFETIGRIGHQLKGSGATFGFPEISEWGRELQDAAASADSERCARELEQLRSWLASR